MSTLAREILAARTVTDAAGKTRPLSSETTVEQCEFLVDIVRRIDARKCLEIGLAFGISALFTCDAIRGKPGARFIAVDPKQSDWFADIGLLNLEREGHKNIVEFHQDYSHNALPKLMTQGLKLDFAYVDSTKVFDALLVDAYYLSRMLRIGGVLVFDDCRDWPGPKMLARYLAKWPHLRVCGTHGEYRLSREYRFAKSMSPLIPGRNRFLAQDVLETPVELGVNAQCVAFEKIGEDNRNWDWYERL